MSATAIEFEGVQKLFGLAFSLGSLTLAVPRGSIYALIGPNGAGKSTALNMLMGMGEPALGGIRVLDRDMRAASIRTGMRRAARNCNSLSACTAIPGSTLCHSARE